MNNNQSETTLILTVHSYDELNGKLYEIKINKDGDFQPPKFIGSDSENQLCELTIHETQPPKLILMDSHEFLEQNQMYKITKSNDSMFEGYLDVMNVEEYQTKVPVVERFLYTIDVSLDKKWLSIVGREKTLSANKQSINYYNGAFLIQNKKPLKIQKLRGLNISNFTFGPYTGYFSKDSNYIYCRSGWNILRKSLKDNTEKLIYKGIWTKFIMLSDRKHLIVFDDNKILLTNLDGDVLKELGKYKYLVIDCGKINDNLIYFITKHSPKGPLDALFFINTKKHEFVKYPFKLPDYKKMGCSWHILNSSE